MFPHTCICTAGLVLFISFFTSVQSVVCILNKSQKTPISSSSKFGVNVERTSIPACKKPLVLDVGVDTKEITNFESLQWRLDPNVNSSLLSCTGFHKVAWSPLNCDIKGRYSIVLLHNYINYICLDI